jgi:hypothetical protein
MEANHAKDQNFHNVSGYMLTGTFCLGFEVQMLPCDLWLILTSLCAYGEGDGTLGSVKYRELL